MKRKILLRTLIPLTTVGITLGATLPLVSCSCNSSDQPLSAVTLTIDSTNFDTYLDGNAATGSITNSKQAFKDYLNQNNVDKIIFDISPLSIGTNAFNKCAGLVNPLKSIAIEFTSQTFSISSDAFYGCAGISQIICSNATAPTITSMQRSAFKSCTNLTGFSRGNNMGQITINSIIDGEFFASCPNLKADEINDSVISINGCAWTIGSNSSSGYWLKTGATTLYSAGCLAVGIISCPFSSTDNSPFMDCASLTEINNLPGGSIGNFAMNNCTRLTTVKFATGGTAVISIGNYAFYNCATLRNIQLSTSGWTGGSSASNIGDDAFNNCGLSGGTITGIGAQDLLNAIRAKKSSWLSGWIAV